MLLFLHRAAHHLQFLHIPTRQVLVVSISHLAVNNSSSQLQHTTDLSCLNNTTKEEKDWRIVSLLLLQSRNAHWQRPACFKNDDKVDGHQEPKCVWWHVTGSCCHGKYSTVHWTKAWENARAVTGTAVWRQWQQLPPHHRIVFSGGGVEVTTSASSESKTGWRVWGRSEPWEDVMHLRPEKKLEYRSSLGFHTSSISWSAESSLRLFYKDVYRHIGGSADDRRKAQLSCSAIKSNEVEGKKHFKGMIGKHVSCWIVSR